MENIKDAIRAGLITPTTKGMLEEAERKVQRLSMDESSGTPTQGALRVLPSVAARFAQDIERLARHDVPKARAALESFLGRVVLKQRNDALVAVIQGGFGSPPAS